MENLLEIKNLKTHFYTEQGVAKAVDEVDLVIKKGNTLGVVGESGCGKSVTALSIMRLIPEKVGKIVSGKILFDSKDLLQLSEDKIREIRGNDIAMIFQEPMISLNPVFSIGDQISEALILHRQVSKKEAKGMAIEFLKKVGISSPETRYLEYPHQMSGGMKQRAMIAMALCCQPKLLIADEPTTALDVTIQAQILELLKSLQKEFHMSVLFITHDLGIVAETADFIAVMYAGEIVEYSNSYTLFETPKHPYTIGLFDSIPKIGDGKDRLPVIWGTVPDPVNYPSGCRFYPRCKLAEEKCQVERIELKDIGNHHLVRCWKSC